MSVSVHFGGTDPVDTAEHPNPWLLARVRCAPSTGPEFDLVKNADDRRWRIYPKHRHLVPTPLARRSWSAVAAAQQDVRRAFRGELPVGGTVEEPR